LVCRTSTIQREAQVPFRSTSLQMRRNTFSPYSPAPPAGMEQRFVASPFAAPAYDSAAAFPAAPQRIDAMLTSYNAARSRTRLHRIYTQLNKLEWLLVSVLQCFGLWPALLQPPDTEALLKEIESTQHMLLQSGSNVHGGKAVEQAGETTASATSRGVRWTASLLRSASQYIYPNAWMPLSFRKTIMVEPPLEPQPLQASTPLQNRLAVALLLVVVLLNSFWLR
jgi:hypothetical protein